MDNHTFIANSTQGGGELEWARYTFICFMALVTVLGVPGNIIVFSVLIKLRNKASTDFFVLTICVMDLFSSTINSTLFIFRYTPSIWKRLASSGLCRLHIFAICVTVISTTLLLAATALDRYRKTQSRLTRDTLSTIKRSKCICIGIISSSLLYGAAYTFFITTLDSSSLKCVSIRTYRNVVIIFSSFLSVVFLISFLIVIVSYSRIAIILRRHHRQRFQTNQSTNITDSNKRLRNRHFRIQPIDLEMNTTSLKIYNSTPTNSNSSYKMNNSSDTDCTYTQNRTRFGNQNAKLLTVSRKVQNDDQDSKWAQPQTSRQFNVTDQTIPESTTRRQPRLNGHIDTAAEKDRRKIKRTTLMMFLITLIYVATWVINWSTQIYKLALDMPSLKIDFLIERLYMINSIINPIMYVSMSTKFRLKAKEMFCK